MSILDPSRIVQIFLKRSLSCITSILFQVQGECHYSAQLCLISVARLPLKKDFCDVCKSKHEISHNPLALSFVIVVDRPIQCSTYTYSIQKNHASAAVKFENTSNATPKKDEKSKAVQRLKILLPNRQNLKDHVTKETLKTLK